MAEKKPNAAPRPNQGVRRSTTHSGVTHVRAYQSGRYTVVGNHLAQHRRLSLTAIGLATHILSLPEGAPVDIRSLADRFPEGRDRIAFALRELEAHGYLERVRERTASGRLFTRTYARHVPVADTARPVAEEKCREEEQGLLVEGPSRPPASRPTGGPEASDVSEPTSQDHRHDRAATFLAGLRHTDARLILSRRDVERLAPAVTAWFESGASAAVVHRALTGGLPAPLKNPAKLLAYRLDELLPVPLPARPTSSPVLATGGGAPHRPDPLQTCGGCERAFRSPRPGRCRDCRTGRAAADEGACAA